MVVLDYWQVIFNTMKRSVSFLYFYHITFCGSFMVHLWLKTIQFNNKIKTNC